MWTVEQFWPEKNEENVIGFDTFCEQQMRAKGSDQYESPPSGIVNKGARRWSGGGKNA